MLNERIKAAQPIAEKIGEVETSLNTTMLKMGELISCIATARLTKGAHFSLSAGVDASDKLIAATATAAQSYRDIVEAHEHLANDRNDARIPETGWGMHECPPVSGNLELAEENHQLTVVNS